MQIRFYEVLFRDAYEAVFGVRPVFSLGYLTNDELQIRTKQIWNAQSTRQLG